MALLPLEPSLLGTHPLRVEAVLGSVESLVTAGAFARVGELPLWLVIVAPLIGNDILDPFSWWTGRRFGDRLLTLGMRVERFRPAVIRAEGLIRRWGPWAVVLAYYLPVPNAIVYLAAGQSGMSLPSFIVLDLAGTALGIVPIILLGYVIGQSAVDLARLVTQYAAISTVVLVALIVLRYAWRARVGG